MDLPGMLGGEGQDGRSPQLSTAEVVQCVTIDRFIQEQRAVWMMSAKTPVKMMDALEITFMTMVSPEMSTLATQDQPVKPPLSRVLKQLQKVSMLRRVVENEGHH